jgi:hypothetical protein
MRKSPARDQPRTFVVTADFATGRRFISVASQMKLTGINQSGGNIT